MNFEFFPDLIDLLPEIPPDSVVSRSVHVSEGLRVTLFGFAPGQELTEHTAAKPAVLHFLSGQADLMLGETQHQVSPGAWVYMPARLPHSILAQSTLVMALYLIG